MDKATQQALAAGAHPLTLALAQQLLGKKDYIGYCEQFVENMAGITQKQPTAIAAWNNAQNRVQGSQGLQPGDLVYFSANDTNNKMGHTGIYAGNNQFISATNNGIHQDDLNNWQTATGQKLLGYIPQGDRQPVAQPSAQLTQPQQAQNRPYVPPPTPMYMQAPTANPSMPNQISQQMPSQTTYGKITVPNIQMRG